MAKITARNVTIFGGGRDVSGRSNTATFTTPAEAPDVSSFGAIIRERLPDGLRDSELSVAGFIDVSACQVDELYSDLIGASAWWGFYPGDATGSKLGREIIHILTDYSSEGAVEGAATTSTTTSGSSSIYFVNSLGNTTLSTVGTSALSSVDFSASISGTIKHFLRILTLTGTNPEIGASLQDSNDDSSYTTIADFGAASSADQVITASTSSASRYRRLNVNLAGTSPCATFQVSTGSAV